jgi:hypothetical protein
VFVLRRLTRGSIMGRFGEREDGIGFVSSGGSACSGEASGGERSSREMRSNSLEGLREFGAYCLIVTCYRRLQKEATKSSRS